jgi:hypothetical protein
LATIARLICLQEVLRLGARSTVVLVWVRVTRPSCLNALSIVDESAGLGLSQVMPHCQPLTSEINMAHLPPSIALLTAVREGARWFDFKLRHYPQFG